MGVQELSKYPPYLEGTVPAFCASNDAIYSSYLTGEVYQGGGLRVPYVRNPVIVENTDNVIGFRAIIKQAINNEKVATLETRLDSTSISNDKIIVSYVDKSQLQSFLNKQEVWFNIPKDNNFEIGAYYKIQLAYLLEGAAASEPAYSSAVLTKYTGQPNISINNLNPQSLNAIKNTYTGIYTNEDKSEPLYSYNFIIRDIKGNIIDTSGWQIHQQTNSKIKDDEIECKDVWESSVDLKQSDEYEIYYQIRTINDLKIQTEYYRLTGLVLPPIDANLTTNCILNKEEGYIEITLKLDINSNLNEELDYGGHFIIIRSDEDSDYTEWVPIGELYVYNSSSTFSLKDWTVEQGKNYKYGLKQKNKNGQISDKILVNNGEAIWVDFDHMYLSDGKRQLKIKFNPKVGSFKNTVLESKSDTIGGQYPFIFRNGNVKYKEFQISGLISYLMDEDQNFLSWNKIHIDKPNYNHQENVVKTISKRVATTNLVDYNMSAERKFKLEVLEWLNNGKPKLFRSAGEGNYVVRLMNVSLTPDDKLGRMLHSFSSTAYEIMPSDYKTLLKAELAHWQTIKETATSIITKFFSDNLNENGRINSDKEAIISAQFEGMRPGDKIKIDDTEIIIGITGSYILNQPAKELYYDINNSRYGSVTYYYSPTYIDTKFEHLAEYGKDYILETIDPNVVFEYGTTENTTSPNKPESEEIEKNFLIEIISGILNQHKATEKLVPDRENGTSEQLTYTSQLNAEVSRIFYLHFYLNNDSEELEANQTQNFIRINDSLSEEIDLYYSKDLFIIPENGGFFDRDSIEKIWIGTNVKVDIYYELNYVKYDKEYTFEYDEYLIQLVKDAQKYSVKDIQNENNFLTVRRLE